MVAADGSVTKVKVLDFGLAKALQPQLADGGMSNSPTQLSSVNAQGNVLIGTAAYMSPEQLRGRVADERSDIWAFGCVLYEMLTGKQTFTGETMTDLIGGIVRIEPDWNVLPAGTPPAARSLVKRCLDKDRRRRFNAVGDVRFDLEEALTAPAAMPAAAPRKSWERIAWSFAAVVVIAV